MIKTVKNVTKGKSIENILSIIEYNKIQTPLSCYLKDSEKNFFNMLLKKGAILFRGFTEDTQEFIKNKEYLIGKPIVYNFRSSPRKEVAHFVYTSTEYPAHQVICQHNENAYTNEWPDHLAFFCEKPSANGGETPITDMNSVYNEIPVSIIDKIKKYGLMYKRSYMDGISLSIEESFQTSNLDEINNYCSKNNIRLEKIEHGFITEQRSAGIIKHPVTKLLSFFNQILLFHPNNLDEKIRSYIYDNYGEKAYPRNVVYGNGKAISNYEYNEIKQIYKKNTYSFSWKKGDILLIDNISIAHGRSSYQGGRKVIVTMGKGLYDKTGS